MSSGIVSGHCAFGHYSTDQFFDFIRTVIRSLLQTKTGIKRDFYDLRAVPDRRYVPSDVLNLSLVIFDTPDNAFMDLIGIEDCLDGFVHIPINLQIFFEQKDLGERLRQAHCRTSLLP